MKRPFVINVIGSGNVARHLAIAWLEKQIVIGKVWSATPEHAEDFACLVNAGAVAVADEILDDCNAVIISVTDSAIPQIAKKIKSKNGIPVFHTSGTQPMSVLEDISENHGVIYPLQTFSKTRDVNMEQVPFFLEASSEPSMQTARFLTELLSGKIHEIDSSQRMKLHLAAIFVSNFTNMLYSVADELLTKNNMSPEWLHPLMIETAEKATSAKPVEVQTGPARRGDIQIIEKHLELLKENHEIAAIYKLLSEEILRRYHPEIQ